MELINKILIINSAWNVATDKNPFLSAILKAKYILTITFGQPLVHDLVLYIGLLSCRSSTIYILMVPCRFMLATHPFGHHAELTYGLKYMIISYYLLQTHLCEQQCLVSGCRAQKNGIISFYLQLLPLMQYRLSQPLQWFCL
jgi:hypothetical protein